MYTPSAAEGSEPRGKHPLPPRPLFPGWSAACGLRPHVPHEEARRGPLLSTVNKPADWQCIGPQPTACPPHPCTRAKRFFVPAVIPGGGRGAGLYGGTFQRPGGPQGVQEGGVWGEAERHGAGAGERWRREFTYYLCLCSVCKGDARQCEEVGNTKRCILTSCSFYSHTHFPRSDQPLRGNMLLSCTEWTNAKNIYAATTNSRFWWGHCDLDLLALKYTCLLVCLWVPVNIWAKLDGSPMRWTWMLVPNFLLIEMCPRDWDRAPAQQSGSGSSWTATGFRYAAAV